MAQKKTKLHRSFGTQAPADRLFDIFNYLVLGLVAVCVLYPLYFIVIASVSDPVAINNGQVAFWPVGFNTTGYEKIFENARRSKKQKCRLTKKRKLQSSGNDAARNSKQIFLYYL